MKACNQKYTAYKLYYKNHFSNCSLFNFNISHVINHLKTHNIFCCCKNAQYAVIWNCPIIFNKRFSDIWCHMTYHITLDINTQKLLCDIITVVDRGSFDRNSLDRNCDLSVDRNFLISWPKFLTLFSWPNYFFLT